MGDPSKVTVGVCFEIFTAEGRGGEKGGNANFKTKHTEPLNAEITPPLYSFHFHLISREDDAGLAAAAPPLLLRVRSRRGILK